jgi:D-aminopeptidase
VLKDGELLIAHTWGYANAERRIDFTPATLFRMCSITKQFTCGLLLDAFPDPNAINDDIAARLPQLEVQPPTAPHLAHNQSGLRDYWAVAMLHGAPVESPFGGQEAASIIGGTKSLHFAPGTRYSYVNQNFRILSDILEHRAGRSFAELLRTRIFDPAGMHTAFLAADTRAMPDATEGYEGSQDTGFRAADNRIIWTGDAGMGASLADMIAWERYVDASRNDPASLVQRLSAPVAFADGAPAAYGFGLSRHKMHNRAAIGHGGALRGWRSHRVYLPTERLSVVVMFNHLSDAHAAASDLVAAALGVPAKQRATDIPPPAWLGAYMDAETGLSARVDIAPNAQIRLRFGHSAELLDLQPDGSAGADGTILRPTQAGLHMHRPAENQTATLTPLTGVATPTPSGSAGRYHSAELNADLTITDAGGPLFGAFSGFLGQGRMELLKPIGPNVWALPCPRALDHTPPGDWTLAFNPAGGTVTVGCWLARGLVYSK